MKESRIPSTVQTFVFPRCVADKPASRFSLFQEPSAFGSVSKTYGVPDGDKFAPTAQTCAAGNAAAHNMPRPHRPSISSRMLITLSAAASCELRVRKQIVVNSLG